MIDRAVRAQMTGKVLVVNGSFFIGDKKTFIRIMEDGADFSEIANEKQVWTIEGYFEYDNKGLVFYVEGMNLVSA
jgi:hypothetical protein